MLKRIISICLLVALISSNFARFIIYAGFELNHKYIAENLCINKNHLWMHCDGRCYFMRKIKEAQDNEKKQERADQKNHFQEALPASPAVSTIAFIEPGLRMIYADAPTPETTERSNSILIPPKIK